MTGANVSGLIFKFVALPLVCLVSFLSIVSVVDPGKAPNEGAVQVPPCENVSRTNVFEICEYNTDGPFRGAPVYLIGDSNANHYKTGFYVATAAAGRSLSISTRGSCPPFAISPELRDFFPASCAPNNELLFEWLKHAEPGLVVMGFSGERWAMDRSISFETSALVPLKDSIMALQKAGHQVAVISPLPSWPDGAKIGPAYCGLVFSLVINCRVTMNLVEVSSDYYWNLSEKVKKAAQSMQVSVIDVVPEICPGSVCETRTRSGDWVWNDRHHISSLAAQKLAPTFRALLSE